MQKLRSARLRSGAFGWTLSRDIGDPQLWTEQYSCPTWGDYLRQRERMTQGDRALQIAADAFRELDRGEGAQARTASFIEALASLSARLGLQQRLRDVGIGRQHLPKLAADAMKQTRLLVNNPRPLTETDALHIYEAAL